MELLIIRHADAGEADEWAITGNPDSQRPISDKGRKQFTRGAKSIIQLVTGIDLVASSPYTRALQTTELLFERLSDTTAREVTDTLVPDAEPEDFVRWLRAHGKREVVAAVGHEPHLSTLASWLIAGVSESRLKLRKGGACLISFERHPGRKEGMLQWLLGPRQLRLE